MNCSERLVCRHVGKDIKVPAVEGGGEGPGPALRSCDGRGGRVLQLHLPDSVSGQSLGLGQVSHLSYFLSPAALLSTCFIQVCGKSSFVGMAFSLGIHFFFFFFNFMEE